MYPIFGWVQMLFGAIAFNGYCRGGHLGQCLAHYIMVRMVHITLHRIESIHISKGGGFIAYGAIMAILLLAGEQWVRRSGRSPEWWDSWIILLWVRALLCIMFLVAYMPFRALVRQPFV
jgi:hypothetical protein